MCQNKFQRRGFLTATKLEVIAALIIVIVLGAITGLREKADQDTATRNIEQIAKAIAGPSDTPREWKVLGITDMNSRLIISIFETTPDQHKFKLFVYKSHKLFYKFAQLKEGQLVKFVFVPHQDDQDEISAFLAPSGI